MQIPRSSTKPEKETLAQSQSAARRKILFRINDVV
jgi:hypothetical protein